MSVGGELPMDSRFAQGAADRLRGAICGFPGVNHSATVVLSQRSAPQPAVRSAFDVSPKGRSDVSPFRSPRLVDNPPNIVFEQGFARSNIMWKKRWPSTSFFEILTPEQKKTSLEVPPCGGSSSPWPFARPWSWRLAVIRSSAPAAAPTSRARPTYWTAPGSRHAADPACTANCAADPACGTNCAADPACVANRAGDVARRKGGVADATRAHVSAVQSTRKANRDSHKDWAAQPAHQKFRRAKLTPRPRGSDASPCAPCHVAPEHADRLGATCATASLPEPAAFHVALRPSSSEHTTSRRGPRPRAAVSHVPARAKALFHAKPRGTAHKTKGQRCLTRS